MTAPEPPRGRWSPRPTRSTGTVEAGSAQLKFYEMSVDGRPVPQDVLGSARQAAEALLTEEAETRFGYVICHHGTEATWLSIDRWEEELLHHSLLRAEAGSIVFEPRTPDRPCYCVWELEVVDHERRAWTRHVLADQDPGAYLADTLDLAVDRR